MFKVIGFLLQFYPVIMVVVSVVEGLMSDRPGDEKKAVVLRAIVEIAGKFGIKMSPIVVTLISQSIDAIVTALNLTGVFTREGVEDAPVVTVSGHVVEPVVAPDSIQVQLDELEAILRPQ